MTTEEILNQLKAIILPYIPEGEEQVLFGSKAYPNYGEIGIERILPNQETELIEPTTDETFELLDLMLALQQCRDFSSEPWTQFQAIVHRSGQIDWRLANIAEEDEWSGLDMKGISELTWQEARPYYIPYDIWKKRSKRYISEADRFYQELLLIFDRNMLGVGWTVLFRGCIYQGQPQYEAFAIDADGHRLPDAIEFKKSQHLRLPKLLRQMQKSTLYPQPWTHFECCLGYVIPFDFQVANIAETDYWPGLYMKGISELNEAETQQYGIPLAIWQQHAICNDMIE